MRFCDPAELLTLSEAAPGRRLHGELVVAAEYDEFRRLLLAVPAVHRADWASLSAEWREALEAARFRRLGSPQRPFRLTARAWFVAGVAA